jgi:hypothetical protein
MVRIFIAVVYLINGILDMMAEWLVFGFWMED